MEMMHARYLRISGIQYRIMLRLGIIRTSLVFSRGLQFISEAERCFQDRVMMCWYVNYN